MRSALGWLRTGIWPLVQWLAIFVARRIGGRRDAIGLSHTAWQEMGRKRWDLAIYYARGAVAADPSYAHGYRMLGLAYLRAGAARARESFQDGTRAVPDAALLWAALGDLERESRRHDEAEAAYREALRLEPTNIQALLGLGWTLQSRGRPREAEPVLDRAYGLGSDNIHVLRALAVARIAQGKFRNAVPLLTEVVKREPAGALGHGLLSIALRGIGNIDGAVEEAHRAADLEPENQSYQQRYRAMLRAASSRPNEGED